MAWSARTRPARPWLRLGSDARPRRSSTQASPLVRIIVMLRATAALPGVVEPDANPMTAPPTRLLNRLLPNRFPTTRSDSPRRWAWIVVTSSGSDVPRATKVNPMMTCGTPRSVAIAEALATSSCAPASTPARPRIARTGSNQAGSFDGVTGTSTVAVASVNSTASSATSSLLRPWRAQRRSRKSALAPAAASTAPVIGFSPPRPETRTGSRRRPQAAPRGGSPGSSRSPDPPGRRCRG